MGIRWGAREDRDPRHLILQRRRGEDTQVRSRESRIWKYFRGEVWLTGWWGRPLPTLIESWDYSFIIN